MRISLPEIISVATTVKGVLKLSNVRPSNNCPIKALNLSVLLGINLILFVNISFLDNCRAFASTSSKEIPLAYTAPISEPTLVPAM